MADADLISIDKYLPGALVEWSRSAAAAGRPPCIEEFEGAFLVVDISGFTKVASRLSRQGGAGVERISEILTDFFTDLVASVEEAGGVVFGFEGDALLAAWRRDADPLPVVLLRCCGCALAIQRKFENRNADDRKLIMRMAIGAGEIELIHLGNAKGRCHLLPAGKAVEQSASLIACADGDEILLSSVAWSHIHECCEGEPFKDGAMRLLRVSAEQAPGPAAKLSPARPARNLSDYLPRALRASLNASWPGWVGELRVATIGFLKIAFGETPLALADLNKVVMEIEQTIDDHDGEILEVATNPYGLELLSVFGLPGGGRENIGQRAILAIMDVAAVLKSQNLHVSAGLATGQVFCGPVGPDHRRQYSVVGAPVYLASRLSSVAAGRILVDEATMLGTSRSIHFSRPWPLHLAGIRESVRGFEPLGPVDQSERLGTQDFVNREREIAVLDGLLRQTSQGSARVALIDGEPGIGKTALIAAFADKCAKSGVQILEGAADALDDATPYLAWRPAILQCLDLGSRKASDAAKAIQRLLAGNAELADLAPLLNDVLDLRLPENLLISNMASDVRAENLKRMLVWIITQSLCEQQNLIIVEDIQWADETSIGLLIEILRSRPNALVIASCRNLHDIEPLIRGFSAKGIDYRRLPLRRLSKKHTVDLACKRLNREQVSDWFAQLMVDTTEGNPFFIDAICHVVNQEKPSLPQTDDPLERAYGDKLPRVLETAVLSRIDHLSMVDQLVAKLASVIGATFRLDLLAAVAPKGLDVSDSIERMLLHQLLKPLPGASEEFAFGHRMIRDVVYESLLVSQKRETHAALARLLESESGSTDSVRLPIILHHWRRADEPRKVVAYLDQVAALRLRQFDNAGAIKLVNECLALAHEHDIELGDEKRAVCHLLLGEAYVGSGRMAGARKSYEVGLSLLGQGMPKSKASLILSLLWQTLRQGSTRLTRSAPTEAGASLEQKKLSWQRFHMAAQAYENLARIYYVSGEKIRLLHSTLKATNLAEDLGECTPALVMNYATLGAICGVIPMRRQAEYYFDRASEVAKLCSEPNVTSTMHLTKGLYRTSIADWPQAKSHFLAGMDVAKAIGDKRRWCELAVSLETICGPWLLTPAFSDVETWDALVGEMHRVGSDRDDPHVLGCAVLGALRGNRVLGRSTQAQIEAMSEFLRRESFELELIHRVEGSAHLASAEFAQGNIDAGDEWLRKCEALLQDLNPGMKGRTLPALSFLFYACMQRAALAGPATGDSPELGLAARTLGKLNHFARIYPIGRPEKLCCHGDFCAITGKTGTAVRLWRDSLQQAIRLEMVLVAFQAAERLKRSGHVTKLTRLQTTKAQPTVGGDEWSDEVRRIAERAAHSSEFVEHLFPLRADASRRAELPL